MKLFKLKKVFPRKVMLAGMLAFCMSFFWTTSAEAQSAKVHIPKTVVEMQTLISNFAAKSATIPAGPKLTHYTAIDGFYQAVVADVQGGMAYRVALNANKELIANLPSNSNSGNGTPVQQGIRAAGPK